MMRFSLRALQRNFYRHKHTASVIFFHGAGDNGSNLRDWIEDVHGRALEFPHINMIYPTAPMQSYTPADGDSWNVWFDWDALDITVPENRQSMSNAYDIAQNLINDETNSGISAERIMVGGFSMGGTLALHTAYHLNTDLAGVFACSTLLKRGSLVYDSLQNHSGSLPELLMFHGTDDDRVKFDWGRETFRELRSLGVSGSFTSLSNAEHELTSEELDDIEQWILEKLPE